MSTAMTSVGAPAADRLACVGVDLTPDERIAYDEVTQQIAELEPRAEHRGSRKALAKALEQRSVLLATCAEKVALGGDLSPRSAPRVLAFVTGTVEDPRDPSYDGSLDEPRRLARAHQVFPRGASPHAIDAFLDSNDWVPDSPAASPLVPPVAPIHPVVVHNVLPKVAHRSLWRRRHPAELIESDDLPPFVRLTLPTTDLCPRCGRPVGWMRFCVCPTMMVQAR